MRCPECGYPTLPARSARCWRLDLRQECRRELAEVVSWVKLIDSFYDDLDVEVIGNEAVGAFVRCLAYCGKQGSDGFIPASTVRSIARPTVVKQLVGVGFLEEVSTGEVREITKRRDSGRRALPDVTVVMPAQGYYAPKFLHYNRATSDTYRLKANGSH